MLLNEEEDAEEQAGGSCDAPGLPRRIIEGSVSRHYELTEIQPQLSSLRALLQQHPYGQPQIRGSSPAATVSSS